MYQLDDSAGPCSLSWNKIGPDIDGEAAGDKAGQAIAMSRDGSILAIGAYLNDGSSLNFLENRGHVRVYALNEADPINDSTWEQRGHDVDGKIKNDDSGLSVAVSDDGSRLAIGGYNTYSSPDSGRVRVFDFVEGEWTQVIDDVVGLSGDHSGHSLAMSSDGAILAIGAPGRAPCPKGYYGRGNVRVIRLSRDEVTRQVTWEQLGADIDGDGDCDESGWSIALSFDGKRMAIGAPRHDFGTGQVRVYELDEELSEELGEGTGPEWKQLGDSIDAEGPGDKFGWSVAMSGDGTKLVVGATYNDNRTKIETGFDRFPKRGHVRVYELDDITGSPTWKQVGSDLDGKAPNEHFGHSVGMSSGGTTIAIAAPFVKTDSGNNAGRISVYELHEAGTCPCLA